MDIRFAIRIESDGQTFRYATKRTLIREAGVADIEYQPYIQKISVPEMEASLDFDSSIPTISVSLWDAYRDISKLFNDMEYEALNVTVIAVTNGVVEGEYSGYMADVKHDAGVTSFVVRMEASESKGFPREFLTHKTFEYTEILNPVLDNKTPSLEYIFESVEDTGWAMLEYVEERTLARERVLAGSTELPLTRGWNDNILQTKILVSDTAKVVNGAAIPVFRNKTASDPGPFYVHVSDVADSKWASTGTALAPQLIRYDRIYNDSGRITLAGIPTGGPYSIREDIEGRSIVSPAVSPEEAETNSSLSMDAGGDNGRGTSLRAARLFVRASKNIPLSIDDPKLSVGFIDLGLRRLNNKDDLILFNNLNPGITDNQFSSSDRFRVPVYHRYHINNMARIPSGEHEGEYVLEIVLNINALDPGVRYRLAPSYGQLFMYGSSQTSGETTLGKLDQEVRLVRGFHYVKKMSFVRSILERSEWVLQQRDNQGVDGARTRPTLIKSRIDMVKDVKSLNRDTVTSVSQDDAESANLINVNNATGKFGVCRDSRVSELDIGGQVFTVEECTFDIPPTAVGIAFYEWLEIPEAKRKYNSNLTNYLTYQDERSKAVLAVEDQHDRTGGEIQAKAFFASNTYRVKHFPIPENPTDLGKMFPIVYGRVRKVPLIHSVSKKTSDLNQTTAGDDVYIYASHKCGVESASDITVHLLKEDGTEGISDDEMREFTTAARDNVIESPFPLKKTIILPGSVRSNDGEYSTIQHGPEGEVIVLNPYHKTDTFVTNAGEMLYGIKLRGTEWNEKLGFQDPIYPIRNGVGNSTLYASYNGYIDETGEYTGISEALIEHPMDVIRHYIEHYRDKQGSTLSLDTESAGIVKAVTPKYHVSMYHVEQMDTDEVIDKICKQFGILRFRKHGKLSFATPVMHRINMSKPLSDNVNLIIGTKEESEGYKKIYNEIVYNYRKNWATGEFDAQVVLNSTNNFYCAQADKARGGKETLTIDADFVNSPAVAQDVADRIATLNSSRKVLYTCEAKYTDGIRFVPGDIIPMTYKHYDLVDEPVMVIKAVEEFDTIKLDVIRFTNLL